MASPPKTNCAFSARQSFPVLRSRWMTVEISMYLFQKPQHPSTSEQYCMGWMPDGERNPTIVYRDWMKGAKMGPRTPSSDVAEYMTMSGIHRCISGHKPHGDVPLTIRAAEGDFTAITCDTSYSGRILGAGEIDHAALQRQWRTRVVASATSMCSPLPHRPVQLCPALPQSTCRPPHPPPFPLPSSFSILSVAIAKM